MFDPTAVVRIRIKLEVYGEDISTLKMEWRRPSEKSMIFFNQVLQRHAKNDDYVYIPSRTSYAVLLINAVVQRFAIALKRQIRQTDI